MNRSFPLSFPLSVIDDRLRDECDKLGAELVGLDHPWYPREFQKIEKPPAYLTVLGEPVWLERPCISIVGSREPSQSTLEWIDRELSVFFAETGLVSVSGGARGIDQRVHASSLRAGQPTVVFLPSGLAQAYPSEIKDWFPEVLASGGAIVSQHAPEQGIRKRHFESRNQLIAALGKCLFVVEAGRRSGSTMTARLARDLGAVVCALPSHPNEPKGLGSLDLLFDGAFPIRDRSDLKVLVDLCQ